MTRDQQTELEKQKGALVAQRAERLDLIQRYADCGKLKVMVALPGHPLYSSEPGAQINLFHVGGVQVFAENRYNTDVYPSQALMATLALAIGATTGLNDIPPPSPTHRVSAEGKEYNRQVRERNKGRPDFA